MIKKMCEDKFEEWLNKCHEYLTKEPEVNSEYTEGQIAELEIIMKKYKEFKEARSK